MFDEYVECPICGFGYFSIDPTAPERHKLFHSQIVEGALVGPEPRDRVLKTFDGLEVLEGATDLPRSYRRKLAEVAYRANYDMPDFPTAYDGGDEDREYDGRIYVLRRINRGIGMLVVRRRSPTWWIPWGSYKSLESNPVKQDDNDRWTVDRIWLLASARSKGFAAYLIRVAADRLGTSIADLAWLGEFTPDGERLIRRLTSEGIWYYR